MEETLNHGRTHVFKDGVLGRDLDWMSWKKGGSQVMRMGVVPGSSVESA